MAFATRPIRRTAHGFAINGHHTPLRRLKDRRDPTREALLKLLRIEQGKYAPEGIMRWNTMGQFQERFQPGVLGLAIPFDIRPTFAAAKDGAQGDDDDIDQVMQTSPVQ